MQKSFLTISTFTRLSTKRFFRDKLAIFFTIGFPLIFLCIFGSLFKTNNVSFKVALINQSNSAYSQEFVKQSGSNKLLKINNKVSTLDQAKEKMKRGEIDATILLPADFGKLNDKNPSGKAMVYYNQNSTQAGQTLASVLQQQFAPINAQFVKQQVPFTVEAKSTNESGMTQFDFTFAGMLGFAIISLGIFGPVNVFPELKKQGILRRLHTTPLRVWEYFTANVISQGLIGMLAVGIMFIVSLTVFDLQVKGTYFAFIAFTLLSIFTIYGIGLAIGGWAKNERQAAPLGNLITFPMIFLSGAFFPRFLMPEWLQSISNYIPLTPVIDGIRLIVTEGKTLVEIAPQIGLLAVWAVIVYFIAFRIFRWE
jgi:ABC-2 type transport system permease protein